MFISRFEAPAFCRFIWNFEIFSFEISLMSSLPVSDHLKT